MPVPISDLYLPNDNKWREWKLDEIYNGVDGHSGRYVPNVDDLVHDVRGTHSVQVVNYVDPTTFLSDLDPYLPAITTTGGSGDLLLTQGPGLASGTFRAFVNNAVLPRTIAIDSFLYAHGSSVTHIKIFLGTETGPTGVVISAMYNTMGIYQSENIPMELVKAPFDSNLAVKTPSVGYLNRALLENEQITVVCYDTVGGPRSKATLVVNNTDWIRPSNAYSRYVTSIRLKSSYLSTVDNRTFRFPANITNYSAHIMGEVTYNDGATTEYPPNHVKMWVEGFEAYVPTIVGQRQPVRAYYQLGADEYNNGGSTVINGKIGETYWLQTIEADNAYSVKIFCYPAWVDSAIGYRMQYWVYSLERNRYWNATAYIQLENGSPAFNGKVYGIAQNITLRLNLNSIDSDYFNDHIHVQPITINLMYQGDSTSTPLWSIAYTSGQETPYGSDIQATQEEVGSGMYEIDISSGALSLSEWLSSVYLNSEPMYHVDQEIDGPPLPTHAVLIFKNFEHEIAVTQYNSTLTLSSDLVSGELLGIAFIKRDGMVDKHLAMGGMSMRTII